MKQLLLVLLVLGTAAPLEAQSLLERPPNVHGDWVGMSGRLYFNFLHRFSASDAPVRKVANVPTFTMAAGLPLRTLIGANYATNSQLAPGYPNEWEFFARHRLFEQRSGAPVDLGGQVAYNLASEGVDGEVSVARKLGPVRAIAAARILADPLHAGQTRFAAAAGATLGLGRYLALAGDVAQILNARADETLAWSAGIHVAIPHTPHTLSLHAANTNAATLQGLSRGERLRYGFEFTVPVTLQRWFSSGSTPPAVASTPSAPSPETSTAVAHEAAQPVSGAPAAVTKSTIGNFAFAPRIEIAVGTTVEWKNEDPVAHTVTAADGAFDSGTIESGATWRYTFTKAGEYPYACTPHPFMKGTVVVR